MPYADPVRRRQYQNGRNAAARVGAQGIATALRSAMEGLEAGTGISEHSQAALRLVLLAERCSTQNVVKKVMQRLESQSFKNVEGELQPVPDNEAQLKAVQIAMELQTRAGLLPSEKQANASGSITINIMSYTSETPRVIEVQSSEQDTE